ncbi:MAG: ABC transporter permease [Bacteroidetes bacterium]|jgi:ABC-2 type transport system permease protein|nr:ABC transporter permease [Bacteroidota bacterium]
MKGLLPVLYREYLIRMTSPMWLFFDLIVPVMYLLMFGVGFNAAFMTGIPMDGRVLTYNEFFLAGVISMACFGLAMNQSYGFFVDRDNGIFYETLTYPITRNQYLLGKIMFQCVLAIVQTVLTLTAAATLLGVSVPAISLLPVFGGVIIGTAGWFFTFAAVAFRIRRNDTFNTIINVAYFLLMFVSSMFYPLEQLPAVFKAVSYANPVTWHTDVLRWALTGIGSPEVVLLEAVGFFLFALAGFRVALAALKRAVE